MRILFLAAIATGVVGGLLYYETHFVPKVISQKLSQLALKTSDSSEVQVNRDGNNLELLNNDVLQIGDIVESKDQENVMLKFSGDGEIRLDHHTRLLVNSIDEEALEFSFKLLEGKVWLMNSYSNADVKLFMPKLPV